MPTITFKPNNDIMEQKWVSGLIHQFSHIQEQVF